MIVDFDILDGLFYSVLTQHAIVATSIVTAKFGIATVQIYNIFISEGLRGVGLP